jgi:hypothetical protein
MGLKDILTQNGSALTYTGGVYPETYIIPTNPLATSPNQGGISLHANPLSATTAAPGASLAGTNTVSYAAVNAAFQSYNDGDPTNAIPTPGGNPGADLDLEGSIPPINAHGNPALLQFFSSQALPYDQNVPT